MRSIWSARSKTIIATAAPARASLAKTSLGGLARAGLLAAGLALAGCQTDGAPFAETATGSAVAFEQIDGLPRPTFDQLVASLGPAAEAHDVRTVSRKTDAPYRVQGYLSLQKEGSKTALAYAWDVYDRSGTRVTRVTGEEPLAVPRGASDPWTACNDAVLDKIADRTMADLATVLSGDSAGAVASAGAAPSGTAGAAAPETKPQGAPARAAFLGLAPAADGAQTLAYASR